MFFFLKLLGHTHKHLARFSAACTELSYFLDLPHIALEPVLLELTPSWRAWQIIADYLKGGTLTKTTIGKIEMTVQ